MEADSTEFEPENGEPWSRLTLGVSVDRLWISVRPLARRSDSENAVIAIGTSWIFSTRFSAVTTISSSVPAPAPAEVWAAANGSRLLIAPTNPNAFRFMHRPPSLLFRHRWCARQIVLVGHQWAL